VKDFVKESWKIGAAFAAGAFLLSLLIGLITRNPFGTVFVRALLLALLFAGLGAGLRYLVRTYLPELSGGEGANPAAPEEKRGSRVDIVLDDEAVPGPSSSRSAEASSAAEDVEPMEDEPAEAGDNAARAESQALGELAEELASGDAAASEGDGDVEEAGRDGEAPTEPAVSKRTGAAGLDELPDIGPLEGPADRGEGGGTAQGGRTKGMRPLSRSGGRSAEEAMKATIARQDPAILARALRTVVKRDEKG
jgi:hypothetical protein